MYFDPALGVGRDESKRASAVILLLVDMVAGLLRNLRKSWFEIFDFFTQPDRAKWQPGLPKQNFTSVPIKLLVSA